MPRNGTGGYNLPAGINPVVSQTLITSNWANQTMNDLAAAITQSLSKDGQTVPTANLPMGNFRHTGVGDPAARNNYASLGYVQDGKDKRLTIISGLNQIDATLAGGGTSLVNGQIVQLIPTVTTTGPVTLRVNGGAYYPVHTEIGNDFGAGSFVAGRPYLLSFDGAIWTVISANAGASSFAQGAMSGWDRPTPDGPYPEITVAGPGTVGIPAGKGRIIHPSARDSSGVKEVAWVAQNVAITNVAVSWTTFLAVNSDGNIVQFTGNFNPAWARDNIMLGTVTHVNGVINNVKTVPAIFGDMSYAAYDISSLLINTLAFGGRVFANAASPFHIDLEAGAVFGLGGNSPDVDGPNIRPFPAFFDLSFFPVTGSSAVGPSVQNVPVTLYDPGGAGVTVAIPGAAQTASIHRLYYLAGQAVFVYGQSIYADLATALSQIGVDDSSYRTPAKLTNATLLSYIVVQKNCTDLKNTATARLVPKGGANFSIGTSGSVSDAPIDGKIYGRINATWNETIPAPKGAAGTLRFITYYTNALPRFAQGLNDAPETGLNAGSNWELRTYSDAGAYTGTAMRVNRNTREAEFLELAAFDKGAYVNDILQVAGREDINGEDFDQPLNIGLPSTAQVAPTSAGGCPGLTITSRIFADNAQAGASFIFTDSVGGQHKVASIVAGKGAAWVAGSDIYPSYIGFWTRSGVAGAGQAERMRINADGSVTIPGSVSVAGDINSNGSVFSGQNFISKVGNVVLATSAPGAVFLRPVGPLNTEGQVTLNSNGVLELYPGADPGQPVSLNVNGPANSYCGVALGAAVGQWTYMFSINGGVEGYRITGQPDTFSVATGPAAGTRFLLDSAHAGFFVPVNVEGAITANNRIIANGVLGCFEFADRAGGGATSTWYMSGNIARLYGTLAAADLLQVGPSGALDVLKTIRAQGIEAPSAGKGLEMYYDPVPDVGIMASIERPTNAYKNMVVAALAMNLRSEGNVRIRLDQTGLGFFGAVPVAKPVVAGSRGGNAALASLITALAALGLVTDTTTP